MNLDEDLSQDLYSYAFPVNTGDIGICYYCGCESEFQDHAPPVRHASFYITSGENCSFTRIAACKECMQFLERCHDGLIEERKKFINKKIQKKYGKALNIYERWSNDEIVDMDKSLAYSIQAGLNLGKEAYQRLMFPGFEYEIEGNVFHARRKNVETFTVFGEEFDNFRNALQYAARSYKININILKEWLIQNNAVFDDAINAYFKYQEEERIRKQKQKLCAEFSKKHKQNVNFVKGALDAYIEANPYLSMEECLQLILVERVMKKPTRHNVWK